jgi:hypothetical protein
MNSMLIVEPSEEAADLPAGLREKCLQTLLKACIEKQMRYSSLFICDFL